MTDALQEQLNGSVAAEVVELSRRCGSGWHCKGFQVPDLFSGSAEWLARCNQNVDRRRFGLQVRDELRHRLENVLAAIQDKQHMFVAERQGNLFAARPF